MLTDKQLKERKNGIGGSDVGPILGLSLWKTPLDVYLSKTEDISQKTEIWHWIGHHVEKGVLIPYYENKYQRKISYLDTQKHPVYSWMLANVDGIDGKTIIECKNSGGFKDTALWGKEGTDEIPYQYLCQGAHYMEVLDLDKVIFLVLFGGNTIEEFVLHRNEGKLKNFGPILIEKEKQFWEEHVLKKNPPEPKNLDDISKLFPYATKKKKIEADENLFKKVKNFVELDQKNKKTKEKINDLKVDILYTMKDAEVLEFGNEPILTHMNVSGKCKNHRRVHIPIHFKRRIQKWLEEEDLN